MAELLALSKDKRKQLGLELQEMIQAAIDVRQVIEPRWRQCDQVYFGEPMPSLKAPWKGAPIYNYPILQTKLDQVSAFTVGSVTNMNPYMIVRAGGFAGKKVSSVENTLHHYMSKAGYKKQAQHMSTLALRRGKAIVQTYYEPAHEAWNGERIPGRLVYRTIDLKNFIGYPATANSIEETTLHGHAFDSLRKEIAHKIKTGEYYRDIKAKDMSANLDEQNRQPYDKLEDTRQENAINVDDQTIATYSLVLKGYIDLNAPDKLYHVVMDFTSATILKIEEFPTVESWYQEVFYHTEPDTFYPKNTRAFVLEPCQAFTQDMTNLTVWGGMYNMIPPTFVTDFQFSDEYQQVVPGSVIPVSRGAQVFTTQSRADMSIFPQMIQHGMSMADAGAKISQMGNAQNLRSDTTATEANYIAQGQTVGVNQDVDNLSIGLSKVGMYSLKLLGMNHEDWIDDYAGIVSDEPPTQEDLLFPYLVEVNGQTPINNPMAENQAAQQLIALVAPTQGGMQQTEMFMQTQPDLMQKLITSIADNSFPGKDIIRRENEQAGLQQGMEGDAGQPGMEMLSSLLPEAGNDPMQSLAGILGGNGEGQVGLYDSAGADAGLSGVEYP